jgi:hypothetical protein
MVLPSSPGHLSTISLSRIAASANFIMVPTEYVNKNVVVKTYFFFMRFSVFVFVSGNPYLERNKSFPVKLLHASVFTRFRVTRVKECPKINLNGQNQAT